MNQKPGLVVNDASTSLKNQFNRITFNLQTNKATLRHDTMEGRDFLVAPCVMITEGVHAGSEGPLYYPANELAKTPGIWNSKPIVVSHPKENGAFISACDPVVFTKQKIGVLMNTSFDGEKLKSECWMEEEKIRTVDERVLTALEEGKVMEVSTGLLVDSDAVEGEWQGKAYTAIARNYRPDHLAVLPDEKGACSISDGAGLLRNAAQGNGAESLLAQSLIAVFNKLSHSDIWQQLSQKIRPASSDVCCDAWISEVWDDYFIYEKDGKTYYQKYSVKDDEISLDGVRQEAVKITTYRLSDGSMVGNAVPGDGQKKKGSDMDKEQTVNQLISNEKSPWTEDDREMLMKMSDAQLGSVVVGNAEPPPKEEPPVVPPVVPVVPEPEVTIPAPTTNADVTVEQYIANAPPGMRDMLSAGLAAHATEKAGLVAKITANKRNLFTPELLNVKGLNELKALAYLAEEPKAATVGQPHYAGMGEPAPVGNQDETEEPLKAPVMNFGKEE